MGLRSLDVVCAHVRECVMVFVLASNGNNLDPRVSYTKYPPPPPQLVRHEYDLVESASVKG